VTIPNVLRVVHGTNVAGRSKDEFNYGLLVEFTTEEAEHAYQTHSVHLAVIAKLKKIALTGDNLGPSVHVVDFAVPAATL
jgi:hypothetical protein